MDRRTKITQANLHTLKPGRYQLGNLCIRVSGVTTFYYRGWNPQTKQMEEKKLGRSPVLTLKNAKDLSDAMAYEVTVRGTHLACTTLTFSQAWERYLTQYLEVYGKPKTIANDKQIVRAYLGELSEQPVKSITIQTLRTLHASLSDRPTTANRVLEVVKKVLNYIRPEVPGLVTWKREVPVNPENKREEWIKPEEIQAYILTVERYLKGSQVVPAAAVLIALYTGLRKNNVLQMEWKDIDLEVSTLRVSGDDTKNGREVNLYLSAQALAVLKTLRQAYPLSAVVFPGTAGTFKEPRKFLAKVQRESGIKTPVTMHTLKHTFVSYAHQVVSNKLILNRLSGHVGQGLNETTYGHAAEAEVRQAYQDTADRMTESTQYLRQQA